MENPNNPPIQKIVIQQTSGLFLKLLTVVGWLGFFASGGVALVLALLLSATSGSDEYDPTYGVEERHFSGANEGPAKVAILDVTGVIMSGEGFVKSQIDRIREDEDVKAVVLRVDSPGGTISGSDYMYHYLTKLREERNIPLVVSMGSIAASGGYYVSMAVGDQEDSIFAEPTSTTGSIGVIIPHYDVTGLLERFDIKNDSIASHPRKQMLSMTREIRAEDRELLQSYVDEALTDFKEIIKAGRPMFREDEAALDKLATGEIFSAKKAKDHGLVDRIGFLEDAINRAIELASLDKDQVKVVRFERPLSVFDVLSGAQARGPSFDIETLFELSSPKAYCLTTSAPILVRSGRQ